MAILILRANGFIGSAVPADLSRAGHEVIGLGRDIAHARNRWPLTEGWIALSLALYSIAGMFWLSVV